MCLAYKHLDKGKLDPKCEQGVFVGYDKNSPAYLVYYPDKEKVQKHRLVKFPTKNGTEKETQTCESYIRYGDGELHPKVNDSRDVDDKVENVPYQDVLNGGSVTSPEQTENAQPCETTETVHRRNPPRNRKKPVYLQEFETEDAVVKLQTCVDSCYRAVCDIPQTYKEAITSNRSKQWKDAMDDEVKSLEENETFSLTPLPPGKQTVGGNGYMHLKVI